MQKGKKNDMESFAVEANYTKQEESDMYVSPIFYINSIRCGTTAEPQTTETSD